MSSTPAFSAWLDHFFASYFRHRPVNATFVGVHAYDDRLPGPVPLAVVDQPISLADEVVVQRPQGGPQLARRCDGAPAVRLAPEVVRDGADAIDAEPGIRGLAVPQPPAQALDFLGDRCLRRGALRIVGRQAAGDPRQVL
jgi:hypothetical protein